MFDFAPLKAWLQDNLGLSPDLYWAAQLGALVFLILLANFGLRMFLKRVYNRVKRSNSIWDDAIVDAFMKPLPLLVWVFGITAVAKLFEAQEQLTDHDFVLPFVDTFRDGAVATILAWLLFRLTVRVENNVIESRQRAGKNVDRTTINGLAKLLRATIIVTGTLVVLQSFGISVSALLAFGGVGGLAVGFAAKDLLANFFGALMIYMDRPFEVGDWIRSPDKNIEGTVEHIGWRLTKIRTFDKRPLYVPNAIFASIAVENPSRMTNRRIKETIGLRYADAAKIEQIVTDVRNMLRGHEEIDSTQTLIVNFDCFSASSLDFFIYCFTETTNWVYFHEVKQDVLLKIVDIVEQHDAEMAFPSRSVYLESMPEPEAGPTSGPSPTAEASL